MFREIPTPYSIIISCSAGEQNPASNSIPEHLAQYVRTVVAMGLRSAGLAVDEGSGQGMITVNVPRLPLAGTGAFQGATSANSNSLTPRSQ